MFIKVLKGDSGFIKSFWFNLKLLINFCLIFFKRLWGCWILKTRRRFLWGCGESNPGHHELQSCALPLSYIPYRKMRFICFLNLLKRKKCKLGIGHLLSNFVIEQFALTFNYAALSLAPVRMFVSSNPLLRSSTHVSKLKSDCGVSVTEPCLTTTILSESNLYVVGGPSTEPRNHSIISCSFKSRVPKLTTQLTKIQRINAF